MIAPYQTDVLEITDTDIINELTQRIQSGLTTRDAINEVTDALGVPRKRVYTLAVAL